LTMQSPTQFTLDFGSVQPNSGNYMAMFGVQNFLHDAVFQDSLGGQFDISMIGSFGASGTDPFSRIGPNSEVDPSVSFNSAMTVGTYTGRITVNPTSTNTSGTSNLNAIQLNLTATIIPEPSSWVLGLVGGSLLVTLQRFRRRR
ncbi:MAG: hypothetical protein ACJ8HU_12015, partial [Chthoniobacterales bacterium]